MGKPTIFSLKELMEWEDTEFLEWKKTRRVGCAQYNSEHHSIDLYVYESDDDPYFVDIEECCESGESFAEWIWHLHGMSWKTPHFIQDFLDCLNFVILEETGRLPEGIPYKKVGKNDRRKSKQS